MTGTIAEIVPSTVAALTGVGADALGLAPRLAGARRAVLLLIDGLGYELLPTAATSSPVIADVLGGRVGSVTSLSSCFPSTTPTSLVSLGTGALPGAHGVLGFGVNVPGTDRVLNHTRWSDDPDPRTWQPLRTQFELADVRSVVFGPAEHQGSGLTIAAYGDTPYAAITIDDVTDELLANDAQLMYAYHPTVDKAGHLYGVGSSEWLGAVAEVDGLVARLADRLPADTALIVTADHGMMNIAPADKIDVDSTPALRAGVRVLAGEPRVRYVHTAAGATGDVMATWSAMLGDRADVLSRADAIDAGWFGPVSAAFTERIGDVVVICRGGLAVVATEQEPIASRLVGYHGSTSRAEVAIPLIVIPPR